MTTVFPHISDMTPDDCKRVTDVTCLGLVYGTLTTLRCMPPRDRGTIVQVGSALAYRSVLLQSAYCVAKNALVGFTDSLRSELIHDRSQCARDCCGHASRQYTAVQLMQVAHALQGATGAADIPAGGVRGGGVLGCPPAPSRSLRRLATARAIWASASCPAFLDRVAAKLAWDGLFYDGAANPDGPNNLHQPVPGHQSARTGISTAALVRTAGSYSPLCRRAHLRQVFPMCSARPFACWRVARRRLPPARGRWSE